MSSTSTSSLPFSIEWKSFGTGFVIGSFSAIALYKLLNESDRALMRRLKRKNTQGARAVLEAEKKLQEGQRRPVRIWIDGCFDLMHFGHANAFRQARALGDYLIVGLNPDCEIIKQKGPPIMNDEERYIAVAACKWVDEVVRDVPYAMDMEYLQMIFDKYKVDYVVHGDDPCLLPDGSDVYATAKKEGRFRLIKRTEGVSTTDIVGRMLLMTKDHHYKEEKHKEMLASSVPSKSTDDEDEDDDTDDDSGSESDSEPIKFKGFVRDTQFLPTTWRINQFASNKRPKPNDKIVYIDGAWDMFHAGHIETLKEARELGDFLIVGVQSDHVVNKHRGKNYPIMNTYERVLSVLACRYVDEVVIGAPWELTKDMITTLNISVVTSGHISDSSKDKENHDPYRIAKDLGIYKQIQSKRTLTTEDIVRRIFENRNQFEEKFEKKSKKEAAYNEEKTFIPEL